jgi:hypothetical protein
MRKDKKFFQKITSLKKNYLPQFFSSPKYSALENALNVSILQYEFT